MGAGVSAPHRPALAGAGGRPAAPPPQPEYDPQCYLCPGNARAGGVRNPDYTSTFVFDNDFAALKPDHAGGPLRQERIADRRIRTGHLPRSLFLPRHNLTIAGMEPADLRKVVDVWVEQYAELGSHPAINYVQIFENRGAMMGASNPHPHCQIWSSRSLPNEVAKEQASQAGMARGARRMPSLRVR